MHVVLADSIISNVLQKGCLIAGVQLRAWHFYPGSVGGGDPQEVDAGFRKDINVCSGDPRCVATLKDWTTLRS